MAEPTAYEYVPAYTAYGTATSEPPYCNRAGQEKIAELQEQVNEAVRLLTDLWRYDNLIRPIDGVVYSSGTHSEVRARVSDFLARQASKQS